MGHTTFFCPRDGRTTALRRQPHQDRSTDGIKDEPRFEDMLTAHWALPWARRSPHALTLRGRRSLNGQEVLDLTDPGISEKDV